MTFDSKDELHKIRRLLDTRAEAEVSTVARSVTASVRKRARGYQPCRAKPM